MHICHVHLYTMTGMFYYVLGNIRPELRSTLRAIQLIAYVTCRNLNKYGFEKILNPFIEDVNTLSEVTSQKCDVCMYIVIYIYP